MIDYKLFQFLFAKCYFMSVNNKFGLTQFKEKIQKNDRARSDRQFGLFFSTSVHLPRPVHLSVNSETGVRMKQSGWQEPGWGWGRGGGRGRLGGGGAVVGG